MQQIRQIQLQELESLKKDAIPIINPMNLTDSDSQTQFYDEMANCIYVLPPHDDFYASLVSRNKPLISNDEQQLIRQSLIVIAGQGTVGGNLALALIRYGFENIRIADNDVFEIANLNRQPCDLASIGISKSEHIAILAKRINPYAKIEVFADISADNVETFVTDATVVISALDNPHMIVQLNQEAQKMKRPLLMGTDLGAKVLFDFFDYPNNAPLLNGRVSLEESQKMPTDKLVTTIVGVPNVPVEMLQAAVMRLRGEINYFAQTVVSASLCTAILVEGIKNIVLGKTMKKKSFVDLISIMRPFNIQLTRKLNWFKVASELARVIRR